MVEEVKMELVIDTSQALAQLREFRVDLSIAKQLAHEQAGVKANA